MKAAAFHYECPETVEEAIALLAAGDGNALPLAGGQSLVPMMAFRLATPTVLVDLRRLSQIDRIETDDRGVTLGARVRWRDILADARIDAAHPLLKAAVGHVAHYQIRNRGTVGGSLALADPAAELPGIAVTCDAEITVQGSSGRRIVPAGTFFVDSLTTVLAHDELILGVRLPPWLPNRRWAFQEVSRRHGDFAIAGVALFYDSDGDRARNTHIGVIGASPRPHRLTLAERIVDGQIVDAEIAVAAGRAAADAVTPVDGIHGSAAYRRALVATLVERCLLQAASRSSAL